jgi:hypothetical protein
VAALGDGSAGADGKTVCGENNIARMEIGRKVEELTWRWRFHVQARAATIKLAAPWRVSPPTHVYGSEEPCSFWAKGNVFAKEGET